MKIEEKFETKQFGGTDGLHLEMLGYFVTCLFGHSDYCMISSFIEQLVHQHTFFA